ncbi:oxidoreductase [Muricoccus nepalensis]|nr:oxidoreductase [Roseomonas nepalensis]
MPHDIARRTLGALALGAMSSSMAGAAGSLPQPAGRPILTVSGRIAVSNRDGAAVFDLPMLEALGTDGFETRTPWHGGMVRFDGVRMHHLMQAVGASGENVTAIALNDYTTDLPIADFERYGVLLAMKRDGVYMPVRDKGPLFIVYPYDSKPELRAQQYYSRSAWQVAKLVVT